MIAGCLAHEEPIAAPGLRMIEEDCHHELAIDEWTHR